MGGNGLNAEPPRGPKTSYNYQSHAMTENVQKLFTCTQKHDCPKAITRNNCNCHKTTNRSYCNCPKTIIDASRVCHTKIAVANTRHSYGFYGLKLMHPSWELQDASKLKTPEN